VFYARSPFFGKRGRCRIQTDAYLVALAAARKGLVATMDEGLAAVHGEFCELV